MKSITTQMKKFIIPALVVAGLLGLAIGAVAQSGGIKPFLNESGLQTKHGSIVISDNTSTDPSAGILDDLKLYIDSSETPGLDYASFNEIRVSGQSFVASDSGSPVRARFGSSSLNNIAMATVEGNILGTDYTDIGNLDQFRYLCADPDGKVELCQVGGGCTNFPGVHTSQPANAGNGCTGGFVYTDEADTPGEWQWRCADSTGTPSYLCSAQKEGYSWNVGEWGSCEPGTAGTAGSCSGTYTTSEPEISITRNGIPAYLNIGQDGSTSHTNINTIYNIFEPGMPYGPWAIEAPATRNYTLSGTITNVNRGPDYLNAYLRIRKVASEATVLAGADPVGVTILTVPENGRNNYTFSVDVQLEAGEKIFINHDFWYTYSGVVGNPGPQGVGFVEERNLNVNLFASQTSTTNSCSQLSQLSCSLAGCQWTPGTASTAQQTREVTCQDSNGNTVPDNLCPPPQPEETQPCGGLSCFGSYMADIYVGGECTGTPTPSQGGGGCIYITQPCFGNALSCDNGVIDQYNQQRCANFTSENSCNAAGQGCGWLDLGDFNFGTTTCDQFTSPYSCGEVGGCEWESEYEEQEFICDFQNEFTQNAGQFFFEVPGCDSQSSCTWGEDPNPVPESNWQVEPWGECVSTGNGIQGTQTRNISCPQGRVCPLQQPVTSQPCSVPIGSGKVICTELHRQGFIPDEHIIADNAYGSENVDPKTLALYHVWAKPLVTLMQGSTFVTEVVRPYGVAWAHHMAYLKDASETDSYLGRMLHNTFLPIHDFLTGGESDDIVTEEEIPMDVEELILFIALIIFTLGVVAIALLPIVLILAYSMQKGEGLKKVGDTYICFVGIMIILLLVAYLF